MYKQKIEFEKDYFFNIIGEIGKAPEPENIKKLIEEKKLELARS